MDHGRLSPGRSLRERKDMFLAIIWALLNLAPRKDDERVRILTFTNVGITATVKTSFIRVTGVPPRILPLQYGNVDGKTA